MTISRSNLLLAAANALIPVAILTFALGFFPYKPFIPGLAKYEELELGDPPQAPFDRVIFMVVDALRSDFVFSEGSGFTYTQSLISDGSAMPFTAHATSPTITMPRIKAITTGSIPSFLDVILNFAESDTTSSLATQDTWLAQMKAKETGKMVMYGDDTWLKLFPQTFDRADGTSSFFVADFTEVDNNVTRHVPEELRNDDWSTMVLHYLGLDHIGHKAGPRSPNMIPKQREMDGIVQQIYESMESQAHHANTLLVLCGDHGMNDAGNHGGSAPGETSPALVFISPKLKIISSGQTSPVAIEENFQYYSVIEQSDIAPTLAGLLGFPVPQNNLGAFIVDFLPFWPRRNDRIQLLLRNAKQILNIVTATFSASLFEEEKSLVDCYETSLTDIEQLGCRWVTISRELHILEQNDSGDAEVLLKAIDSWSKDAQDIMSSTASNYDMTKLITGQVVAALASIFAIGAAAPIFSGSFKATVPFIIVTLLYGIMMFASSFVEEEHNFWYWAATGWLALLSLRSTSLSIRGSLFAAISAISTLATLRIVRRWNQTGQKYAGEPDIARTYLSGHNETLWGLVTAAYLWNTYSLAKHGFSNMPRLVGMTLSSTLTTIALTFKLAFTMEDSPELLRGIPALSLDPSLDFSLVNKARAVFVGIAAVLAYSVVIDSFNTTKLGHKGLTRTLHNLLVLVLMTQSRAINIPLILLFEFQYILLTSLSLTLIEITTTSLLLQYLSFFAFGGTNSISSVDLSSAYNGISGFNVVGVGFLTILSNWTGPIYWTSATTMLLLRIHRKGEKSVLKQHLALLTVFVAASLFFVMAACTLLRTHLFIWTVFSPKYLYSMAWSFSQHLLINISLGSLLFWLGSR